LRGPAEMIRVATARPGEITLICVGPLTNLAIALNVEPQLPKLLAGLVIMGGAFNVGGNVTPHAEFNIFADPDAAAQVFAARFRSCRVVGLDVTQQACLTRTDWERVADLPSAAARLTHQVCRRCFEVRGVNDVYLHDPLTVAATIDSTLLTWARGHVEVSTDGDQRGMTRLTGSADGTVEVAMTVDNQRFRSQFLPLLGLV
ncbi:MAG: nucleoside hydrolase, partial [Chloroflexota bacterium]|nr:nucleoside hydrolase [Chloroflexota bacterium]